MKKAVGHLIPFMEKEREERLANQMEFSAEDSLEVHSNIAVCSLLNPLEVSLIVFSRMRIKHSWLYCI